VLGGSRNSSPAHHHEGKLARLRAFLDGLKPYYKPALLEMAFPEPALLFSFAGCPPPNSLSPPAAAGTPFAVGL